MVMFSFCSVRMVGNTLFSSCSLDYSKAAGKCNLLFLKMPPPRKGRGLALAGGAGFFLP